LATIVESVAKRTPITLNEEKLIQRLRSIANGLDIDLDDYTQELEQIASIFASVAEREHRDFEGDLSRIRSKNRSALAAGERREAEAAQKEAEHKAA
jgi:hypothetical protein